MTKFPTNKGEKRVKNLSIIIPHYQKQKALEETWDELILQVHPDDQILIVDDHSPDGVPDFNCHCTKVIRPPRVTPHIWRLNTLRNYGLEHAKYDPCIILDPDCIPNPRFLDNARKRIDASILFGGCIDRKEKDGSVTPDSKRNGELSYWCDLKDKGGAPIRGGIMMFSKKRTKLIGWFNEDYNGAWGMAEHDFASKCYHSGMRLRFSTALSVTHQWHPKYRDGYEKNRERWLTNRKLHRLTLNFVTPYNPAVAVLVVPTASSHNLDKVMQSIFRNNIPIKTRIVNNGGQAGEKRLNMVSWGNRWTVDYVSHDTKQDLSDIYADAVRDYSKKGYKYLITIDDNVTPISRSITTLLSEMEEHKPYHALSGYLIDSEGERRFMGGKISDGVYYSYDTVTPETFQADYINSMFTIVKLNKLTPHTEKSDASWSDYGWSNEVTKQGLQVGITGKAGAHYHQAFTTEGGNPESAPSSPKKRITTPQTDPKRPIKRDDERVAVSVLTMMRPAWLKQCLESIPQNKTPLKIILTNQADYSEEQMTIINQWKDRPDVHYRVNDPPKWPGASRAAVFQLAKEAGYEYVITLDDDCVLLPNAIDELVKAADEHREFYAMSGYLITPHRGEYMLGGTIVPVTPKSIKHSYINFAVKPGVRETDFISNGFRLIRLEPLVIPDVSYTIGLTDFDWAMQAKSKGLKLAVCGEAGAYHKFMFINGEPKKHSMSKDYRAIRRNRVEIRRMKRKFETKWGIKI